MKLNDFWRGFICGIAILVVLLVYQFYNRDAQFYKGYQAATHKLLGMQTQMEIVSSKRELTKLVNDTIDKRVKK